MKGLNWITKTLVLRKNQRTKKRTRKNSKRWMNNKRKKHLAQLVFYLIAKSIPTIIAYNSANIA